MRRRLTQLTGRITPQPLVGAITTATALAGVALVFAARYPQALHDAGRTMLFAVALELIAVLAHRFPIHIRHNSKVDTGSVALYLMAVLLPVPIGAVAVGGCVLASEMIARGERGTYLSDIASETGRWVLIALLGSLAAHASLPGGETTALVAAALIMWVGDPLTCPLTLAPVTGESPLRLMVLMAREAGAIEGVQYIVGLLGVLGAMQHLWTLVLLAPPTIVAYVSFKSSKEVQVSTRQILESMADTVDLRDPYTGGHSRRVAEYSVGILQELPMRGPEADLITWAARVHDIGKIGTPDDVLKKPGPLRDEEWAIIEMHPVSGADLLIRYPDFSRGAEIVRHHHEAWDGTGYPDRLKGNLIPLGARIIAVADSFDAMTSDRPYRRGMPVERALSILREGRGRQWDAPIVDAFVRSIAGWHQESSPGTASRTGNHKAAGSRDSIARAAIPSGTQTDCSAAPPASGGQRYRSARRYTAACPSWRSRPSP